MSLGASGSAERGSFEGLGSTSSEGAAFLVLLLAPVVTSSVSGFATGSKGSELDELGSDACGASGAEGAGLEEDACSPSS